LFLIDCLIKTGNNYYVNYDANKDSVGLA